MKLPSNNLLSTSKQYAKKLIIPAAFATGLTACVGTNTNNSNGNTERVTMHQQVEADTFEADKKIKIIQPKEFNNNEKLFQKAIIQALPFIKDGKFKKVEAMENGIIIDDEYKLHKKGENYYKGSYSLFDNHSFKIDKLKNGNFNLIYKNDDEIEALAFSKDGKLLSKFEAFKQNSADGPYKVDFKDKFRFLPENTDDKIVIFNNPLSDKEFNVVKDLIVSMLPDIKIVDAKQEGTTLIFNYNTHHDFPEGEYAIKLKNKIGLHYTSTSDSQSKFEEIKINALDNGGYVSQSKCFGGFLGYDRDIKYFDKDLNLKDPDWYMQEKVLRKKIETELSAAQMEAALENIKSGKPAQYKLGDNYLILLPNPNEKVVGDTSLSTRTATSCEEVRKAIDNLDPEAKALIVTTTIAVGGIMVEAVIVPTAPMIALGAELVTF